MAAQPVSQGELGILHERISRDLATLRDRWRPGPRRSSRAARDLITVMVEVFRVVQAARGLVTSLRPAVAVLAALAAARRMRR